MKKILGILLVVICSWFVAGHAYAREGNIELSNSKVSCVGTSLWKESSYRVMGRCDGLVYPYITQYEHYVIWAKTDARGEYSRIGEVDRGYFDGNVSTSFGSVYITAETDGLPRRPSDKAIVSGTVTPFAFDKSTDTTVPVASTAPTTDSKTMTVQNGVTEAKTSVGSVIGKILSSLLIIIAVVIVLVVITSLIFRRRGSVSS